MAMRVTELPLEGLKLIELELFRDDRGFFTERFNVARYESLGLPSKFFQDNHSRSKPGVLRGLHGQREPSQGKLVGVIRGEIWDVAVDIRPDSKTFGRSYSVQLSDVNGKLLWIPSGFAHGFYVTGTEPADVLYKADAPYSPGTEFGLRWDDPLLAIDWPSRDPIVSARDQSLGSFMDYCTASGRDPS